jgi:hypothetical protein
MNTKNYFKQKLFEDLMTPELQSDLFGKTIDQSRSSNLRRLDGKKYDIMSRLPHLFRLNKETGKPEQVQGVQLHPELHSALMSAIDREPLTDEQHARIKDFVKQHGPFTFMNDRYYESDTDLMRLSR